MIRVHHKDDLWHKVLVVGWRRSWTLEEYEVIRELGSSWELRKYAHDTIQRECLQGRELGTKTR